ncbi:MAG: hypothetical protein PHH24_00410 [Candidatus Moranbacteria bacterium]|nr:hypothetical protein [Candidatus Moranbacteria bacterium]MDD5652334.1 hypothetical protein [Candidatus Moranbacteria bacterium]MDX9855694.1 hypothetical protein [Candidatus Moranbacteria bacterium]
MLSFLVLFLAIIFAANSFAADCRILGVKEVPGSISGASADYEMVLSLAGLEPGELFFQGQEYAGGPWKSWPIVDNKNGTATAKISGWESGQPMEFSYGRGPYWTDPSCSSFEYEGHFRVVLGEKREVVNIVPGIVTPFLLREKKEIPPPGHACVILGREEISVDGLLGTYKVTVSLQNFHDAQNVPGDAAVMIDRETAPNDTWTGFYQIQQVMDLAFFTVEDWPRGFPMRFSLKRTKDGIDYWPDIAAWNVEGCSEYIRGDNEGFVVPLGTTPVCDKNNTGDELIRHIENLGNDTYRVYLNYDGMPIANYQALVTNGQSAPDSAWIDRPVTDDFPCYYADIYWPYKEAFPFTYCVDTEGGWRECVDPTGSSFECEGHLCIPFSSY